MARKHVGGEQPQGKRQITAILLPPKQASREAAGLAQHVWPTLQAQEVTYADYVDMYVMYVMVRNRAQPVFGPKTPSIYSQLVVCGKPYI